MSSTLFKQFRQNISVANSDAISTSYCQITNRLNKDFWNLDSDSTHRLQVGSYGRNTAIHGVSDLDMVFELPSSVYERFSKVKGNGPSQLLQEVRESLKKTYPNTKIKGDGQVVVIDFAKYRVEVLPAFRQADGQYRYGDTHDNGSWDNYCNPRAEIDALNIRNSMSNRNLKHVCKMLRAWKNYVGAPMSGMLIDTLAYNFFKGNSSYNDKSYAAYPELLRDIFSYLGNQPEQEYWKAPGSLSRVGTKGKFQRKANKAATKCQSAIDEEKETKKAALWKEIFGRRFPVSTAQAVAKAFTETTQRASTEEFIEDKYLVDIQYDLDTECIVAYAGNEERRYRLMEGVFPWLKLGRSLTFKVVSCNVPPPYEIYWKVRNEGPLAEKKNMIRGQIQADGGLQKRIETSNFGGAHFVDCFVIKDGVCVARNRIDVPIEL